MNSSQILSDDVIHLVEGLGEAITTGKGAVTLDAVTLKVAGRNVTLTPTIDITVSG